MTKAMMIAHRCAWAAFLVILVAGFFLDFSSLWGWLAIALAIGLRFVLGRRLRSTAAATNPRPPVEVDPPVTGRWSALNSPASKVPSHGLRAYGQAYAIDVVAEPTDRPRPGFAWWWPVVRRSREFPAFEAPLRAVADATVVRAVDRNRDHLSRNSLPALLYLMVEGVFREIAGPGQIFGNRLVLDLGDGTYAAYAHLRRGSLLVREGDRVRAGQVVARCGNSGNSSEPHVHFQLMDNPDLDLAQGIPFTWRGVGVPANGEIFSVPAESVTPGVTDVTGQATESV